MIELDGEYPVRDRGRSIPGQNLLPWSCLWGQHWDYLTEIGRIAKVLRQFTGCGAKCHANPFPLQRDRIPFAWAGRSRESGELLIHANI